jgi:tripartite-type tricarboxylate transporter receptor subunit TctC
MNSKAVLKHLLVFAVVVGLIGPVAAQSYPSRPVTVIVPYTAGGPTDVVMRALAEVASKHLGQPIVIENKAGGTGTIGPATMAATAKPDGYTLSQMPVTTHRLPLMQSATWKTDDFTYILQLSGYVFAMFASADTPFKAWEDVVEFAKKNPGKVTYATPGPGSSQHIGTEMIAEMAAIKLVHVPFKGATEVNAAVAGGHVMLGVGGTSAKPLADSGKLRFLNAWTARRVPSLPETPTLAELGYPVQIDGPFGLTGPKGMDPTVVQKIHDAFKKALEDSSVIEALARFEMTPNYKGMSDYRAAVQEQIKIEQALLGRMGLLRKD